jgi:hypothetical protein
LPKKLKNSITQNTILNIMDKSETYTITKEDLAPIFGEITDRVAKKIKEIDLQYTKITLEERDECIRRIVETLLSPQLEVVGEHRHEKWEKGWTQNLEALQGDAQNPLLPRYKNDPISRWKQEFIRPVKERFDEVVLAIILEWIYEKYMKDASVIYNFGCGTGHHLLQLQAVNPTARLVGLDWTEASQKIIAEIVKKGMLKNTTGRNFNFFEPDRSLKLEPESVVYTIAALEQVGKRHEAFVDYLLEQKPALCVHVEPIAEVLDPSNLLDFLSIEYFKKRNYLWGFLTRLRELEAQGKVKIHNAQRTFLGANTFVDHYSVIVWSPL